MGDVPQGVRSVFLAWAGEFAETVWGRFQVMVFAAILCVGRHTVCRVLRYAGALAEGHWSSYHRVLSKRRWSIWRLGRILARHILERLVPKGTVSISGDDTVTEHRGKKVYGKGRHRDAVRSTHSFTTWRWGHKWVVLAIHVWLPGMNRPWALPVLCALYRTPEENKRLGRRHKTPGDLMRQLSCVLLRWFPDRKFQFAGDGGYGSHKLARFAARRPRLTLVSKFYSDANLYDPPPKRKAGTNGRPPKKGKKRPTPEEVVANTRRRTRLEVSWYGGGRRQVAVVTGTGHWYKAGEGLVEVRWVFVEDRTGTHRDEYFFTTDVGLTSREIIEAYTGRWSIEVMFEEVREHLGLETTRGWCEKTILRAEPCLFGLYSLVVLWFAELPEKDRRDPKVPWFGTEKTTLTFSDAITLARRQIWRSWVFESPRHNAAFRKLTPREKQTLIDTVTQDSLLHAGFSEGSDRATALVQSFEQFITQHKDEITALQILYSRPTRAPSRTITGSALSASQSGASIPPAQRLAAEGRSAPSRS